MFEYLVNEVQLQYFKSNITWSNLVFFKGHIILMRSINKWSTMYETLKQACIFEDLQYRMVGFYYVAVELIILVWTKKIILTITYTFMALKRFPHSKRDSKSRVTSSGEASL